MQDWIVLDRERGIAYDPRDPRFSNVHVLYENVEGLKFLALKVAEFEQAKGVNHPFGDLQILSWTSVDIDVPPLLACAFNWFSVTLSSHLRAIALMDLMMQRSWDTSDLVSASNRKEIKDFCGKYVADTIPDIHRWRNKVAAHFAATDPYPNDNELTLAQSMQMAITYQSPHYFAGLMKLQNHTATSDLPTWSVTKTFQEFKGRFWS